MKNSYEDLPVVFTIGHSTLTLDAFINLLKAHSITMVADVRKVPCSRHNPLFNRETLPDNLHTTGIGYIYMTGLGGLRRTRKDSPNAGWRNLSFRGFADYMMTQDKEIIRVTDVFVYKRNEIPMVLLNIQGNTIYTFHRWVYLMI